MSDYAIKYRIQLEDDLSDQIALANQKIQRMTKNFSTTMQSTFKSIKDSGRAGMMAITAPIVGGVGIALAKARELEKKEVGIRTKLVYEGKGEEEIKSFINELKEFARTTPFSPIEVFEKSGMLMALGTQTKDVISTMRMLGDVANATGGDFGLIAKAYADIQAKGKLQAQEILQLANQSVGIRAILAEELKVTPEEVLEMGMKGQLSSDLITKIFQDATKKGGRFFGAMDNMMKGFAGSSMLFGGTFSLVMSKIGGMIAEDFGLKDVLVKASKVLLKMADTLEKMNPNIRKMIFGIGLFAAAIPPILFTIGLMGGGLTVVRGVIAKMTIGMISFNKSLTSSLALSSGIGLNFLKLQGMNLKNLFTVHKLGALDVGLIMVQSLAISILNVFKSIGSKIRWLGGAFGKAFNVVFIVVTVFYAIKGVIRGILDGMSGITNQGAKQINIFSTIAGLFSVMAKTMKIIFKLVELIGYYFGKVIGGTIKAIVGLLGKIGINLPEGAIGKDFATAFNANLDAATPWLDSLMETPKIQDKLPEQNKPIKVEMSIKQETDITAVQGAKQQSSYEFTGKNITISSIKRRDNVKYIKGEQLGIA